MTAHKINIFYVSLSATLFKWGLFIVLLVPQISMANSKEALFNAFDATEVDIPMSRQTDLGRAFIFHLHSQYDLIDDPEINHYIQTLGHRIAQHTHSNKHFRFYIINNPDINAFAGPDGVIGIHTGLIQSVSTEDELASVIAHEIAHVTQEHLYRRMALQSEQSLPQIASMIAAILIGMSDPNAGMAALMGSSAFQIEKQLKYSRMHEYEADHEGIELLNQSGYNPHAMPDFFEKLAKSYQHQGTSMPEILRTHPLSENRLAKAQARAHSLNQNINKLHNTTLKLIQIRLENIYQVQRPVEFDTDLDQQAQCYQSALKALNDRTASQSSFNCIDLIIKNGTKESLFHALALQLDASKTESKTNTASKNAASFSYELFPSNQSIILRYAEWLKHTKNIQKAIQVLENYLVKDNYKISSLILLAKLHENQGNTAKSYYFLSLAQLEIGNLKRAAIFITKAKNDLLPKNVLFKDNINKLEEKLSKLLKKREERQ